MIWSFKANLKPFQPIRLITICQATDFSYALHDSWKPLLSFEFFSSRVDLLLLNKTHYYTKGEITNFYLKERMLYIPVQDVDMFSTIHSKSKTFGERLKNKFNVWYKF